MSTSTETPSPAPTSEPLPATETTDSTATALSDLPSISFLTLTPESSMPSNFPPTGAGLNSFSLSDSASAAHAGALDPGVLTPVLLPATLATLHRLGPTEGGSSTVATPGDTTRVSTPLPVPTSRSPSLGASPTTTPSTGTSIAPTPTPTVNGVVPPAKKEVKGKTSVFGKIFGGDSKAEGSPPPPLVRKASKKEEKDSKREEKERKEAMERADKAARAEEKGYKSGGEKEGMGAALNEFMRNKVARKGSVGKRSEDERSVGEKESAYGGSAAGSKAGTTASLLKKYGVCEKVAIGKGATAVVKLAHKWDRTTERLYAVKEFRKRRKNETEKEYVKKLTSEFCISSTLHHHNIVETVDLVQDEQAHWCEVMEYCPGGDLYAAIKKGNMSSATINSYFKQILSGVSYLHSMGVAHRDIKPENLLLDAKGHVKITDFGVSDVFRMCWEKTTHLSKGLCGSEPYIAPEQFDLKEYDARLVDVWACAVVFYCMHFQELPWRVAKPSDPSFGPYLQMYSTSASPPPLSNLVPRECRNIIKRMLDPDPRTRVTTEMVLEDPWFKAIVVIPPLENGGVVANGIGSPALA